MIVILLEAKSVQIVDALIIVERREPMIDKIIGRDPNCFTGGDCWNYDYSDRWLLLAAITISIVVIARIIRNKRMGK